MAHACKYLKDNGRPANIPIARVLEGQKCADFDRVFQMASQDWHKIAQQMGGRRVSVNAWK